MNVILLEKIRNLGELGQEVKVKPGYARNFLLPYGKAVIANEENKAKFEARRAELEKTQAETLAAAQERGGKMDGATVQIPAKAGEEGKLFGSVGAKAGEEGKLFGSVGAKEIADALNASGFEANRSEVQLPEGPIKEIGDWKITLALHPEVSVAVTVSVVAEQ